MPRGGAARFEIDSRTGVAGRGLEPSGRGRRRLGRCTEGRHSPPARAEALSPKALRSSAASSGASWRHAAPPWATRVS